MKKSRSSGTYSINDLVWSFSKKIRAYLLLLVVAVLLGGATFFLRSSNRMLCSLIETKLGALSSPLSRELALGDEQTANAIFSEFKEALRKGGASANLILDQKSRIPTDLNPACVAGLFTSEVRFPISFGDEALGAILGSVSYFSFPKILLVIILTLTGLATALKILSGKLTRDLQGSLIDPMLALSKDAPLPIHARLPSEIFEIQNNIEKLKEEVQEKERVNFSLVKSQELGQLAAQVAHDIRSPLTTLMSAVTNTQRLLPADERNQLRASASRIQKIADDLIAKYREPNQACQGFTLVAGLINSIVLEKNVILKSQPTIQIRQDFSPDAVCLGVSTSDSDLSRVLSNLINNSIEATKDIEQGVITVRLLRDNENVKIIVEDNGRGMPEEILDRVRTEGGTYGKASGLGMGLQHAKRVVSLAGGRLTINSKLEKGTSVVLDLPIIPTPSWFAKELSVSPNDTIVVLDDDESVHLLWKQRLSGKNVVYLKTPTEFDLTRFPPERSRYIFDLEILGCSVTGLDLIRSLALGAKATLVTSYHDDPKVQMEISRAGATLLPKFMIPFIPIQEELPASNLLGSVSKPDLVLVDDDPLIHHVWMRDAKESAVRLLILDQESDLSRFEVDFETPIFVDKNLGNEMSGVEVARRLFDAGYRNIFLATGEDITPGEDLKFLAGIQGKKFPENLRSSRT